MLTDLGMAALGAFVLLLGTDSTAKGLAGAFARDGRASAWPTLVGVIVAAVLPGSCVLVAALALGDPDLALGGLVGGAFAQGSLVLGVAAIAAPLVTRLRAVVLLGPVVLVATVLLAALAFDTALSRIDGAILVVAAFIGTVVLARALRGERAATLALAAGEVHPVGGARMIVRVVIGLALAGLGAWLVVRGSRDAAAALAWNPFIAGLLVSGTAVALAALPGVVGAARTQAGDAAVGQAMLAAFVQLTLLAGIVALVAMPVVPSSLARLELPALFALALATYPMMRSDGELSPREGGILVGAFVLAVAGEIVLAAG
ncbi:sodium:calcium antiporter [Dokdonella sp. MW10]|uniref:sodium:calcium antiporter n=1 Tax=Dokdonella sp. MW10 TaxID=2992926 RepID=UPI003F80D5DF